MPGMILIHIAQKPSSEFLFSFDQAVFEEPVFQLALKNQISRLY